MEITNQPDFDEVPDMTHDVMNFVRRQIAVKSDKLTLDTRILHDLYCDGEDAEDFLLEFSNIYNVDLAEFQFDKYFDSEYYSPTGCKEMLLVPIKATINFLLLPFYLALMIYWSFDKKAWQKYQEKQNAGKLPLTIRDLVQAATTKKWPELPG